MGGGGGGVGNKYLYMILECQVGIQTLYGFFGLLGYYLRDGFKACLEAAGLLP